jgi:hypothetical protein
VAAATDNNCCGAIPSTLHNVILYVFSRLSSPLHDLLTGSAQQDQQQLGVSEKDQTEIAQWVEKAGQPDFVKSDAFLVCVIPRHNFISIV